MGTETKHRECDTSSSSSIIHQHTKQKRFPPNERLEPMTVYQEPDYRRRTGSAGLQTALKIGRHYFRRRIHNRSGNNPKVPDQNAHYLQWFISNDLRSDYIPDIALKYRLTRRDLIRFFYHNHSALGNISFPNHFGI